MPLLNPSLEDALGHSQVGLHPILSAQPAVFSPSDLNGLVRWYDSSDAATITEILGDISQYDDKHTPKQNATQITASKQPAYLVAGLNGLNVIDFDKVAKQTMDFAHLNFGSSDYTIHGVFVMDSTTLFARGIVKDTHLTPD